MIKHAMIRNLNYDMETVNTMYYMKPQKPNLKVMDP